ncbi:unnamed protein product (macronuclear) [Paramecium tetraurelia]|uniref:Transmembrane protein n=1 Tax=Paramecium tetraurelia TaxID=5888 RepID=A0BTE3_PARTE|nr:uncharacterized protein GSPATT00032042001 [Paramecium tetraurelia]CAK61810.1 unnamed protein product [Paramecium tetraurelia]|eukprot:XP_001429208.1 hypothetical protein (macronuclear) [Paramecium tetraurelia strain d4-2]
MVHTSQGCTKFQKDSVQIFSSQNEQVKLNYEDVFMSRDFSNIQIIDQSQTLSYIDPIKLLEQVDYDSTQILAVDVLQQDLSYEWKNKFAALVKNNNKLKISISNQINRGQKSRIPQFDKFSTDIDADFCFDLAFLSDSTVVADCIYVEENGGMQNVMFFWDDETQTFMKSVNDNLIGYTSATKRKLLAANKQLFRASLYDLNLQQYNSVLEVFNQQGMLEYYLDSTALKYLTSTSQNLQIVDFRISTVGQIAILNYDGCVLVLNYSKRETQWKLLHEFQHGENVKSFDFNFKKVGTYVINYGNKILFQTLTDSFSQILDTQVDQIYMAQSVIFTLSENKIIRTFDLQLRSISQKEVPNIQFLLNDYTQDDIIAIKQFNIGRYLLLNQHSIVHKSNIIYEDTHVSQIIQNLPNNEKCTFQIHHSTVSTDTERIFVSETNQSLFSGAIPTYPKNAQIYLNVQTIQGQNIKIKALNISNNLVNLHISVKKFDNSNIQIQPSNSSLTFFSVAQIEQEYLIAKQFNNDWVQFTYCSIANSTCQIFQTMIKLDYLRQNNSCTWSSSNTMLIAYPQTDPYTLFVFTMQNKKIFTHTITTKSYGDKVQKSKEVLLLLSIANSTIEAYYSSYIDLLSLFEINSQTIQALGVKKWAPSGIHANPQSTKVFVRNQEDTEVIILSCSLIGFSIIDILTFEDKVQDILIFEKYFAIMIGNQYLIYDMVQQEDIHFVRQLPSFGYKMNMATRYTYDGWIYIISDNKLLVYNVNKLNVNSFWHKVDVYEERFLTAFDNKIFIKEDTIIEFYHDFQIQSTCEMKNSLFIEQINMTTFIENQNQNIILSSVETIRNFQTQIQLNQDDLNVTQQLSQKYQDFCETISDDWIKNSIVTNIELNCRDCNYQIQLQQYLNLNQINYFEAGVDIKDLDQNQLIILYPNKFIIIQTSNKQIIQQAQFDQKCTQILYSSSSKILLKCNIQDSLSIMQWRSIDNTFKVDKENLIISSKLIDIALFGQDMFLIEKYLIAFYQCNEDFRLNQCKLVTNMQLPGYYMNIIQNTSQYYIYYYDYQLNILPFDPKQSEQQIDLEKHTIDINKIIKNHGFQNVDEEWLNLHIISSEIINQTIKQELLFISQTYLHFQIHVELSPKKGQSKEKLLVFQNYADWIAIKSISYQNKVIIQYQKDEQSILTLYQQNQYEVINPIGGIAIPTDSDSNFEIISELYQPFLYSVDQSKQRYYNKYSLNDKLELCIKGKIENEYLQFNVSNGFTSSIASVQLLVVYNYFTFWQIWVLIIVILICFGIGYYFWRKRQNEKKRKLYLIE